MAGAHLMNRRAALIGAAGANGILLARDAAAVPEIDTGRLQGRRMKFPAWCRFSFR